MNNLWSLFRRCGGLAPLAGAHAARRGWRVAALESEKADAARAAARRDTAAEGCGYLEDRRPASNVDPRSRRAESCL